MRQINDFYPTPTWATEVLLKYLPIKEGDTVLEPATGDGAISSLFTEKGYKVHTNDIDRGKAVDFNLDLSLPLNWAILSQSIEWDWCITNPPFASIPSLGKKRGKAIAHIFIREGFFRAKKGAAFLLRKSITEPVIYRKELLKAIAEQISHLLFLERISFTLDGDTDLASCDWVIIQRDHKGGCVLKFENLGD